MFLPVNWSKVATALPDFSNWNGRILIDTTNPMQRPQLPSVDLAGRSTSIIEKRVPSARVVKAFNHHSFMNLEKAPDAEGGRLIERLGYFGLDMDDIEEGSRLFQARGGPLIAHDFVKFG